MNFVFSCDIAFDISAFTQMKSGIALTLTSYAAKSSAWTEPSSNPGNDLSFQRAALKVADLNEQFEKHFSDIQTKNDLMLTDIEAKIKNLNLRGSQPSFLQVDPAEEDNSTNTPDATVACENGQVDSKASTCVCNVGYSGSACDSCATGYITGTSGVCDTCNQGYSGKPCAQTPTALFNSICAGNSLTGFPDGNTQLAAAVAILKSWCPSVAS